MKLGTFVGRETVCLSDAEIQYISKKVSNLFKEKLGKLVKVNTKVKTTYDNKGTELVINFTFKNEETRRSLKNNARFKPSFIMCMFFKHKGYDEAEVGRFYEWKDDYKPTLNKESYTLKCDMYGDYCGYNRKNIERCVGIARSVYEYGTELEDLNINEIDKKIIDYYLKSVLEIKNPIK